jgi:glycosyltransferase involved in cell wall biosynthesis
MKFEKNSNFIHFVYRLPLDGSLFNFCNKLSLLLFKRLLSRNYRKFFWPKPIKAPLSITKAIADILVKNGYKIKVYDVLESHKIRPQKGDILLGHPMPNSTSLTNINFSDNNFFKKFIISPYNSSLNQVGFLRDFFEKCNAFFAICGDIWLTSEQSTFFTQNNNKFIHLNMGINPTDYPKLKFSFNKPGARKFFYIGRPSKHDDEKGIELLKYFAQNIKNFKGGCIYPGKIEGWKTIMKPTELSPALVAKKIASEYDFFINCSRADAQATTVLESMSWGFPVVCTKESGYCEKSIFSLQLNDFDFNSSLINKLQNLPEIVIRNNVEENYNLLQKKYIWEVIQLTFLKEFEREIYEKNY